MTAAPVRQGPQPPAEHPVAPAWETTAWFGSEPLTLAALRGRVVVVEAFQMLCPSCVSHAIPQAKRLRATFGVDLAVVGLHTVFEHHDAMGPVSLEAFLHEYRIDFPVGVDAHHADDPYPVTFSRYGMRGTPTTVLIDRSGRVRAHHFGSVEDMSIGASVASLLAEPMPGAADAAGAADDHTAAHSTDGPSDTHATTACTPQGCPA